MLVTIAIMLLLIIVVFAFVLEPVLRARRDRMEWAPDQADETIPDFRVLLPDYDPHTTGDEEREERQVAEGRALESQS